MNMFARFNENPAMTLQDIKETKRYGRTDGRTNNVKTAYPLQTKFAECIKRLYHGVKAWVNKEKELIFWYALLTKGL